MQLTFLGGADEIGASSTLVTNGGRRVLVDCGVRMGAGRDPLPHLAAIDRLDAIVITHAHQDHTGALPVVAQAFPQAPIYATAPTIALLRVMLNDALRLTTARAEADGDVPLYGPEAVHAALARLQAVPLLDPIPLDGEHLTAEFFPAGHILGAASVGLTGPEGKLLMSGDFAVGNQLTVPGMLAPRFEPDVMVVESTYGDRLHASREAEERRLIAMVAETIAGGGKVLVPAFALGRAQEVLLILKRAMARKELDPVPVWADGMVRSICEVYRDFPEHLHVPLRRQMAKSHPFFPENGTIRKVASAAEREKILEGPPCVIVASSGMLSGGASVVYAKALAGDRRHLIALTGYQDEESPGRALLDLADGRSRELRLAGQLVTVEARVAKVGLSAHADRAETLALLTKLRPDRVVLVHGEGAARVALAASLGHLDEDQIHLPGLGETLDFAPRRRRERPPSRGIGRGAPLDAAALALLAAHVQARPRLVTPRELAILWAGGPDVAEALVAQAGALVASSGHFVPDRKRPYLYRLPDPAEQAAAAEPAGLNQQRIFEIVDRQLPAATGLYRRGLVPEDGSLVLAFNFPDVAASRLAQAIQAVAAETGLAVRLKPEPHMGALADRALAVLPAGPLPAKPPSIRLDERLVVLKLPAGLGVDQLAREAFEAETGFRLAIEALAAAPVARPVFDAHGRLEINAALAFVDRAFADQPHAPRKKSKRADAQGPFIELNFVSRAVGARYQALMHQLELETGWNVRLGASADQAAILAAVRELVPAEWLQAKAPGLHLGEEAVAVRLSALPSAEAIALVGAAIAERTGFSLRVERG